MQIFGIFQTVVVEGPCSYRTECFYSSCLRGEIFEQFRSNFNEDNFVDTFRIWEMKYIADYEVIESNVDPNVRFRLNPLKNK